METFASAGKSLLRKKMTKGRPDLWTLGLLRSNKKRGNKRNGG
jgi:hypothetical protein